MHFSMQHGARPGCHVSTDIWDTVDNAGEIGGGDGHHPLGKPRDGEASHRPWRHWLQLMHVRYSTLLQKSLSCRVYIVGV